MKLTCKHPDKDCPKLMCGHPLPCPWHTAQIDLTKTPAEIRIPVTAEAAWNLRYRLAEITECLEPNKKSSKRLRKPKEE